MDKDETAAALAQIERNREGPIHLTRRLVCVPAVHPRFETDPAINREAELQGILYPEMGASGLGERVFPGRLNLTGTMPGPEA